MIKLKYLTLCLTSLLFLLMTCFSYGDTKDDGFISVFSETEYNAAENIFSHNTDHVDNLIQFIEQNVLPSLPSKHLFLDIGAGPGLITEKIADHFDATTVVEPDNSYASIYQRMGYKAYLNNFQNITILDSFDLVLCSHVLYHIPRCNWNVYLEKIYDCIVVNGKGIVTLIAPRGAWHDLRASINPNHPTSQDIRFELQELGISYKTSPIRSLFKVSKLSDFLYLVRLFTIDDCFSSEEFATLSEEEKKTIYDKIDHFVASCKQPDGSYILTCEDDYFIINKD